MEINSCMLWYSFKGNFVAFAYNKSRGWQCGVIYDMAVCNILGEVVGLMHWSWHKMAAILQTNIFKFILLHDIFFSFEFD